MKESKFPIARALFKNKNFVRGLMELVRGENPKNKNIIKGAAVLGFLKDVQVDGFIGIVLDYFEDDEGPIELYFQKSPLVMGNYTPSTLFLIISTQWVPPEFEEIFEMKI